MFYGIIPVFPWKSCVVKSNTSNRKVPWNSIELVHIWFCNFIEPCSKKGAVSYATQLLNGIPWNSGASKLNITMFNGIPWNFEVCLSNKHQVPFDFHEQFHGIPWNLVIASLNDIRFPRPSNGFCINVVGTLESPYQISQNPMQFHGTRVASYQLTQGFIEFRGVLHGIQCNYEVAKSNITEFQGIRLNFEIVTLIGIMFPWTSIEYSMQF